MKGRVENIRNALHERENFFQQKFDNYTVCKSCHIIFVDGKWIYNEKLYKKIKEEKAITKEIICPVCRQIQGNYPLGLVYVKSEYIENIIDDVKNLIKNLEDEQIKKNHIMDRFMSMSFEDGYYIFKTTTSKFGKKIANKIEKLIHKKGEYHWSDNENIVQIYIR